MHDTTQQHPAKELAQRRNAGLEVTLYWSAEEDSVTVTLVNLFARRGVVRTRTHIVTR